VLSGVSREKRTTDTCLSAKQIQMQRPEMKQDDDRIGIGEENRMNSKGQWRFLGTPASMKTVHGTQCRGKWVQKKIGEKKPSDYMVRNSVEKEDGIRQLT